MIARYLKSSLTRNDHYQLRTWICDRALTEEPSSSMPGICDGGMESFGQARHHLGHFVREFVTKAIGGVDHAENKEIIGSAACTHACQAFIPGSRTACFHFSKYKKAAHRSVRERVRGLGKRQSKETDRQQSSFSHSQCFLSVPR